MKISCTKATDFLKTSRVKVIKLLKVTKLSPNQSFSYHTLNSTISLFGKLHLQLFFNFTGKLLHKIFARASVCKL